MLSDHDRGWIEALLDGEGSLCLSYGKQKTSPRYRIDVRMDISNTNLELLEKAREILGGGSISSFESENDNRKKRYRLCCRTPILRNILPQLELIVKRPHKKLILEALSLIEGFGKGSRKGFQGGKMRPLWKDLKFAEIKGELNKLNSRGRKGLEPDLLVRTHIQDV